MSDVSNSCQEYQSYHNVFLQALMLKQEQEDLIKKQRKLEQAVSTFFKNSVNGQRSKMLTDQCRLLEDYRWSPVYRMKIKTQYINSSTPVQLIILCPLTAALAKIASVDWCKNSSTARLRSLFFLKFEIQRACRVYSCYLV